MTVGGDRSYYFEHDVGGGGSSPEWVKCTAEGGRISSLFICFL
jgi:hypothetical protein